MLSIWRTVVSWALLMLLAGCAQGQSSAVYRVALLAPFEGEHRHIGYNALYAARLGLQRAPLAYDLLAVDDGGSVVSALERAAAIQRDPSVVGVIVVGPFSVQPAVQARLERPVVIAGGWGAQPAVSYSVQLASRLSWQVSALADERADHPSADIGVVFLSAATPPPSDYEKAYRALGPFTPPPNTYATLVTDAVALLIASHQQQQLMRLTTVQGINGFIRFDQDGYWVDAPLYRIEIRPDGQRVTRLN